MRVIEEIGKGSESNNSSNDESNESNEKRKGDRTLVFKQAEKDSPAKNTRNRKAATTATESPAAKRRRGKK